MGNEACMRMKLSVHGAILLAVAIIALCLCVTLFTNVQLAYAQVAAAGLTPQATGASQTGSSDYLKVSKYKITAQLDTKKNTLSLDVTATIKNNSRRSFSALYFRNTALTLIKRAKRRTAGNDGKKARITQIRNLTTKKDLKYSNLKRDRSIVKVKLGKQKLKPGKTIRIRLSATIGIPNSTGKFGYQKVGKGRQYVLTWCFPYLADYRSGRWSLNPLPVAGENRLSRVTKYDVTFKAPKSYKVACTGVAKTRKGVTRVKAGNLREFALVACNVMKKDVASVRGVTIVNWYLPGALSRQYRADTMPALKDAVAYLTDHVGKCQFIEVDFVQTLTGLAQGNEGSVEHPGLVTMEGDLYYYKDLAVKPVVGKLTRTAYHEMAHQWFYAAVGNDEYNEPWLDEGFASYYDKWALWSANTETTRYLAQAQGIGVDEYLANQRESFRKSLSDAEKSTGVTNIAQPFSAYKSYFASIYSTAPWFLVQLRETVGDSVFDAIMRDYYATYRLHEATTGDFLRIVRSHASGEGVEALLAKYFSKM